MLDSRVLLQTMITLATASVGLVAALAWYEAIRATIEELMGTGDDLVGLTPTPWLPLWSPWSWCFSSPARPRASAGKPPSPVRPKASSDPWLPPPLLQEADQFGTSIGRAMDPPDSLASIALTTVSEEDGDSQTPWLPGVPCREPAPGSVTRCPRVAGPSRTSRSVATAPPTPATCPRGIPAGSPTLRVFRASVVKSGPLLLGAYRGTQPEAV